MLWISAENSHEIRNCYKKHRAHTRWFREIYVYRKEAIFQWLPLRNYIKCRAIVWFYWKMCVCFFRGSYPQQTSNWPDIWFFTQKTLNNWEFICFLWSDLRAHFCWFRLNFKWKYTQIPTESEFSLVFFFHVYREKNPCYAIQTKTMQ